MILLLRMLNINSIKGLRTTLHCQDKERRETSSPAVPFQSDIREKGNLSDQFHTHTHTGHLFLATVNYSKEKGEREVLLGAVFCSSFKV